MIPECRIKTGIASLSSPLVMGSASCSRAGQPLGKKGRRSLLVFASFGRPCGTGSAVRSTREQSLTAKIWRSQNYLLFVNGPCYIKSSSSSLSESDIISFSSSSCSYSGSKSCAYSSSSKRSSLRKL